MCRRNYKATRHRRLQRIGAERIVKLPSKSNLSLVIVKTNFWIWTKTNHNIMSKRSLDSVESKGWFLWRWPRPAIGPLHRFDHTKSRNTQRQKSQETPRLRTKKLAVLMGKASFPARKWILRYNMTPNMMPLTKEELPELNYIIHCVWIMMKTHWIS